ncbi:hypothetical protein PBI_EISH_55 [Mycobacterium phage Eish]|uniref:Uncharacterized protein n=1 Tax=Mycobacterium phage Eish TaxID=2656575 RepID=A0A649V7X1_9CAUD|nr:hypothetical protein I5H31_gp055 [Mycobacterium phage Eish]QGJ88427.1 hypothetical protein PBI_EISH_55 [Mycobacterium phage Eish]
MRPFNLDRCAGCGHTRQNHDERFIPNKPACPMPCECVSFREPEPDTEAHTRTIQRN